MKADQGPMLAYPLQWPAGRGRRSWKERKGAPFKTFGQRLNVEAAVRRLRREIDLLGSSGFVLSTNQELRKDGVPRVDRATSDPAVVAFFTAGGKPYCMPCDTYDRMADNIVERCPRARLLEIAAECGAEDVLASLPPATPALVDAILFSPRRDPAYVPAELRWGAGA